MSVPAQWGSLSGDVAKVWKTFAALAEVGGVIPEKTVEGPQLLFIDKFNEIPHVRLPQMRREILRWWNASMAESLVRWRTSRCHRSSRKSCRRRRSWSTGTSATPDRRACASAKCRRLWKRQSRGKVGPT